MVEQAPTIKDLKERLEEAIEVYGEKAEWYGFDDGSLHIWTEERKIIRIYPDNLG